MILDYSITKGILTYHEDGVIPREVIMDIHSNFGWVIKDSPSHKEMERLYNNSP